MTCKDDRRALDDAEALEPHPGERLCSYRLRILEHKVDCLDDTVSEIVRLRRDGAIGILVVLIAMALSSPQVWGVVMTWVATARQALGKS